MIEFRAKPGQQQLLEDLVEQRKSGLLRRAKFFQAVVKEIKAGKFLYFEINIEVELMDVWGKHLFAFRTAINQTEMFGEREDFVVVVDD